MVHDKNYKLYTIVKLLFIFIYLPYHKSIYEMQTLMKKIFTQQFMGILAGLATIILSITVYAYKSDQNDIKEKIEIEVIQRQKSDTDIKDEFRRADIEIKAELRKSDAELKQDIARDLEQILKMQAETRNDIKELLKRE